MISVAGLFNRMPEAFLADKAGKMDAVVQFDLSGEEAGQWVVTIADGTCSVAEGTVENPKATLIMDASDYRDLLLGKLNPMTAFMSGKVKVEGDLNTIMKFQKIFAK